MDPWEEDDGATTTDSSLQREWESRRAEFHTSGYREGLEEGKQQAVQDGFNKGDWGRHGLPHAAGAAPLPALHPIQSPCPRITVAGYALGSSSGYEWGLVRGAAAMALTADRGGAAGVVLGEAARQAATAVLAVPLRGVAESVCYEALLENAAAGGAGEQGQAPLELPPPGSGPRPPPVAQQRLPLEQALTKLRHAGFDLECQRAHALQR